MVLYTSLHKQTTKTENQVPECPTAPSPSLSVTSWVTSSVDTESGLLLGALQYHRELSHPVVGDTDLALCH